MQRSKQVSESIELGILLTLAGGFMDAYSFVCRGGVFANVQTGNILLFGLHLSAGEFSQAFEFFLPILMFSIGIALVALIRYPLRNFRKIHWRQIAILFEALILLLVAFIPQSNNLLANNLISFACGVQAESFRKIDGTPVATIMCTGNLRSAAQLICDSVYTKERSMMKRGLMFYFMIAIFTLGAVLGNLCVGLWRESAILAGAALLAAAFVLLLVRHDAQ